MIGFCWTERDFRWFGMLERLKLYVDGRRLDWCHNNQQQQKQEDDDNDTTTNNDDEKYRPEWFTISYDDQPNRDLRIWIAVQRKEYSNYQFNLQHKKNKNKNNNNNNDNETKYCAITKKRINALNEIHFPWEGASRTKDDKEGPTVDDWSKLFDKMKEKGIDSRAKAKTHWFEGQSLIGTNNNDDGDDYGYKKRNKLYTEEELLELWNMGEDDDED